MNGVNKFQWCESDNKIQRNNDALLLCSNCCSKFFQKHYRKKTRLVERERERRVGRKEGENQSMMYCVRFQRGEIEKRKRGVSS